MTTSLKNIAMAAEKAYLYTVPLIQMEITRKRRSPDGANVFIHECGLSDHRSRTFTTPNNDTLYSDAWLDLSKGPVSITLPDSGARYFSLALMDMYTNNFSILGTRTTGADGGTYTVVGPDQAPPPGAEWLLRAPTNRVWALGRTLVDGPDDLQSAAQVQQQLVIHESANHGDVGPEAPVERDADWATYFSAANRLLARERPPSTDRCLLNEIALLGLGPNQSFDPSRFSVDQVSATREGIERAETFVGERRRLRPRMVGGWAWSVVRRGDYGQDYLTGAITAVGGIGALPQEEAVYIAAEGGDLGPGLYDGNLEYHLHFAADGLPPVNSFWSISLYQPGDNGERFLANVPSRRYSIGDRTPGLFWNDDGSLDIWVGAKAPSAARSRNWLPAPSGAFLLIFRGYIPKAPLINGDYLLPRLNRL